MDGVHHHPHSLHVGPNNGHMAAHVGAPLGSSAGHMGHQVAHSVVVEAGGPGAYSQQKKKIRVDVSFKIRKLHIFVWLERFSVSFVQ